MKDGSNITSSTFLFIIFIFTTQPFHIKAPKIFGTSHQRPLYIEPMHNLSFSILFCFFFFSFFYMEGFCLFHNKSSMVNFTNFLLNFFSHTYHTPNLGFWPKLAIQKHQCYMNVLGGEERFGLNGAKLGWHSHKIVTNRYNRNLAHSKKCVPKIISFIHQC